MSDPRVEAVLEAVAAIQPVDDREAASIAALQRDARSLRAPFDEHADPCHLTASAFVVGTRGTVLHKHRKLGIWVQPGGHVDPGEPPAAGALREATEETGLVLAHPPGGPVLFHVDRHPGPHDHVHLDLRYVVLGAAMDPRPAPSESQEVAWFAYRDARQRAEPTLVPALVKLEALWTKHEELWRAKVEEMTISKDAT